MIIFGKISAKCKKFEISSFGLEVLTRSRYQRQGRSQTFSFGGATGGASFATRGAVNGLCRTFRKRPEKFWGSTEGPGKIFGGKWPPLAPL